MNQEIRMTKMLDHETTASLAGIEGLVRLNRLESRVLSILLFNG